MPARIASRRSEDRSQRLFGWIGSRAVKGNLDVKAPGVLRKGFYAALRLRLLGDAQDSGRVQPLTGTAGAGDGIRTRDNLLGRYNPNSAVL
jgi:hypothetical protein